MPPLPRDEWAYFFDIDGTLSELAPTPGSARLAPALRQEIRLLLERCGGAIAVVSGRPLREIDRIFAGLALPAAGQHGAERRSATGLVTHLPVARPMLDLALAALAPWVARHPRLLLEDKGDSLALHYRLRPAMAGVAHRVMRKVQRELGAAFMVQKGKLLVELVPAGVDKGRAVRAFLDEHPFQGRLPVFVGDDVSDEAAFAAVAALGGHAIKVGPGPTTARWRLPSVVAVGAWLTSRAVDPRNSGADG